MLPDLLSLYTSMLKSHFSENAIMELWGAGLISGELAVLVLETGILAKLGKYAYNHPIRPLSRR